MQERNNLYTKVSKSHFHAKILLIIEWKVVFGGYGSNRTQRLVMKRSILIEVYRSAHQIIENNFYLTHRTVRHSSPKMTRTLARLGEYIEKIGSNPHVFTAGRSIGYEVPDRITEGFALLGEDADLCKDTGREAAGAEATTGEDIGVN